MIKEALAENLGKKPKPGKDDEANEIEELARDMIAEAMAELGLAPDPAMPKLTKEKGKRLAGKTKPIQKAVNAAIHKVSESETHSDMEADPQQEKGAKGNQDRPRKEDNEGYRRQWNLL